MEFVYMKRLDKKVALITGAARGIGFVIAKAYKGEGAIVVIADINLEAAQKAAVEISDNTFAILMDVTSQESIDNAINEVVAKVGKIDILINNAALFDAAKTVDISRDSYEKLYAVNVAGTLFTLQAVAKQMIKQGNGGKIINMASQAGRRGEALVAVYCSTKAAVISLTQSFGLDLIKHNINVNAICPGYIETEINDFWWQTEGGQKQIQSFPRRRLAKQDDLDGSLLLLAGPLGKGVTGTSITVDDGQYI